MPDNNPAEAVAYCAMSSNVLSPVNSTQNSIKNQVLTSKDVSPHQANSTKPFGHLQKLPAELRNMIWTYILDLNSTRENYVCGAETLPFHDYYTQKPDLERTAILRLCRAIHAEASPLLWSSNRFIVNTTNHEIRTLNEFIVDCTNQEIHIKFGLFVLKEEQSAGKVTHKRFWDSRYPYHSSFSESAHTHNRVDLERIKPYELQSIRHLIFNISDDSVVQFPMSTFIASIALRGPRIIPSAYLVFGTADTVKFIQNLTHELKNLRSLKINIDLGFPQPWDARTETANLLDELEGIRLPSRTKLEIRAICDVCHDNPYGLDVKPYLLTEEYKVFLGQKIQGSKQDVSVFDGTRFVLCRKRCRRETEDFTFPKHSMYLARREDYRSWEHKPDFELASNSLWWYH